MKQNLDSLLGIKTIKSFRCSKCAMKNCTKNCKKCKHFKNCDESYREAYNISDKDKKSIKEATERWKRIKENGKNKISQ